MPSLSLRINLDPDVRIGPGKIELLEHIATFGSISAAARGMEMSYKHAWDLVEDMNRVFGKPLVAAQTGGRKGGGARLRWRRYLRDGNNNAGNLAVQFPQRMVEEGEPMVFGNSVLVLVVGNQKVVCAKGFSSLEYAKENVQNPRIQLRNHSGQGASQQLSAR